MKANWKMGLFDLSELDGLLVLHRKCFGDRGDLYGPMRRRFVRDEYPRTEIIVARDAIGQIVGTQAVTFLDGHLGGRPGCIAMLTMGMVHPDHRGRGLFRTLVESAERHGREGGASVLFTMPNEQSCPAFRRFKSWQELPTRRPYLEVLSLRTLIRECGGPAGRLTGLLAAVDLAMNVRSERRAAPMLETDLSLVAEEVDDLARRCGARFSGVMCLRDCRFLKWRFTETALTPSRLFFHRNADGRLDGYVATACRSVYGVRTAFVVDWLADCDNRTSVSMLNGVAKQMRREGMGLFMSICLPPAHCRLMGQAGLVGVPRAFSRPFHTFFSRGAGDSALPEDLRKARHWYFTLADFDTI